MKNKIRLTESDLVRLVKRVLNEHIVQNLDYKPEDFGKEFNGKKGTWFIRDNQITLEVEGDTQYWYDITCNPQTDKSSQQQQGQQLAKESYLRKGRRLY